MRGNILQKIKKHGIVGSMKVVSFRLAVVINNKWFYYFKRHRPMDEHLIVMESEGDLSDNAFALYNYMRHNDYLEKYHVAWLVDHVGEARTLQQKNPEDFPNTEFVQKVPRKIDKRWGEVLSTCKWYIYDHCNLLAPLLKRKGQKVIYLSHGWGYKAAKGGFTTNDLTHYDMITVTGPIPAKGMSEYWQEPEKKAVITGYPRLDYFFWSNANVREKINQKWHFDHYKKVIFWMPTFRQSNNESLSEDYIKNQTGLPIFETRDSLQEFSNFLKKRNLLLVFKLHHLQADLPVFKSHFDNILLVRDENLHDIGVQLYQFISMADAMISDYSSISIDFLLKDRPIVFTLDDYEEYEKSRGVFPKNAIDYMKGYHVYNQKELEESISEIADRIDKYKDARNAVMKDYHTYTDGNSAKRVLDIIGIKKCRGA
ncbi:CDP-glycerol glycerophosphotransferase family protein [Pseudoramibacter porci]|uniref:CDP-glycerol--glycerophosphate glycerophosphotransferase n=1 Tax=Pseudoramibacter porci TaxID=2606631 RepID=A0A7X2TB37_9FIRM|nr:CDP-glycerol glycerophosphotransferase family protein [Pseudoramibacter porci]MSS20126.1 hypothetical protein [Pseudoramibacter porci]